MASILDMPHGREEKEEYQLDLVLSCLEEKGGVCKTSELTALGVDYRRLLKFSREEKIINLKSGYFAGPRDKYSEEDLIFSLFPDGVLTMESALYFYGYIESRPEKWHIAIDKNTSKSRFKLSYPRVIPSYTKKDVLSLGIARTPVGKNMMMIYEKDRLICDILKYMDKLDKRVLRSAVFSYINDDTKDMSKLLSYAEERRVLDKVNRMILAFIPEAEERKKKTFKKKEPSEPEEIKDIEEEPVEAPKVFGVEEASETAEVFGKEQATETAGEPSEEPAPTEHEDRAYEKDEIREVSFAPNEDPADLLLKTIYRMLTSLSLNTLPADYLTSYNILKNTPIEGRNFSKELNNLFITNNIPPDEKRLSFFKGQKDSRMIRDRFSRLEREEEERGNKIPDIDSCMEVIDKFISPVYESIIKGEAFLSDWMPELLRFLE